jgi:hypothetical protein
MIFGLIWYLLFFIAVITWIVYQIGKIFLWICSFRGWKLGRKFLNPWFYWEMVFCAPLSAPKTG